MNQEGATTSILARTNISNSICSQLEQLIIENLPKLGLTRSKKADAKPTPADYHLDFDSMESLFSDITPARMQVIETSKQLGALSVYALAKAMGRNYSNVHRDVGKLLELELLARDKNGKVYVPWKDVVLNVSLTGDTLAA